jgi:hypothetical protein
MPVDSSNKYDFTFRPYTSKTIQVHCPTENYMSNKSVAFFYQSTFRISHPSQQAVPSAATAD